MFFKNVVELIVVKYWYGVLEIVCMCFEVEFVCFFDFDDFDFGDLFGDIFGDLQVFNIII